MITLKIRNVDRTGKMVKGTMFVSGTLVSEDDRNIVLEVTHYNDWKGTSYTEKVSIAKRRITKRVGG